MSSVSFESVSNISPELNVTVDALRHWIEQHRGQKFVEPGVLFREIGSVVNHQNLMRVLVQLVAAEQLQQRFRVQLPDGTLSEDEFFDPTEVPSVVFDSSFEPVVVTDDRIVAVFNIPEHHGF